MSQTYCHGVDEYVSDCNRLPFAQPLTDKQIAGCALIALAVSIVTCGIACGLHSLIQVAMPR
jgi:hypothetical protein